MIRGLLFDQFKLGFNRLLQFPLLKQVAGVHSGVLTMIDSSRTGSMQRVNAAQIILSDQRRAQRTIPKVRFVFHRDGLELEFKHVRRHDVARPPTRVVRGNHSLLEGPSHENLLTADGIATAFQHRFHEGIALGAGQHEDGRCSIGRHAEMKILHLHTAGLSGLPFTKDLAPGKSLNFDIIFKSGGDALSFHLPGLIKFQGQEIIQQGHRRTPLTSTRVRPKAAGKFTKMNHSRPENSEEAAASTVATLSWAPRPPSAWRWTKFPAGTAATATASLHTTPAFP